MTLCCNHFANSYRWLSCCQMRWSPNNSQLLSWRSFWPLQFLPLHTSEGYSQEKPMGPNMWKVWVHITFSFSRVASFLKNYFVLVLYRSAGDDPYRGAELSRCWSNNWLVIYNNSLLVKAACLLWEKLRVKWI